MSSIIEFKNITKEYRVLNRHEGLLGSVKDLFSREYNVVKAVDDISLTIESGEIVGYLGPNGSGKSTTIKMMTGVLEPTNGTIMINDNIPYKNRTQCAQNIGVVFGQRTQLWWSLPVIESFKILKAIYQISDEEYKNQIDLYESLVDIKSLYNKTVREMSLGQRTLCDILAAFLHNPSVIFLDEPTIGLDVSMKAKIRELIKELNKIRNTTVLLTTHDIGDVEALCQRIIIIDKGSIIYDDTYERLKGFFGTYRTLKLKFYEKQDVNSIVKKLCSTFPISVSINEGWLSIVTNESEVPVINILQILQEFSGVKDIEIEEVNTETIIKKIYEGSSI